MPALVVVWNYHYNSDRKMKFLYFIHENLNTFSCCNNNWLISILKCFLWAFCSSGTWHNTMILVWWFIIAGRAWASSTMIYFAQSRICHTQVDMLMNLHQIARYHIRMLGQLLSVWLHMHKLSFYTLKSWWPSPSWCARPLNHRRDRNCTACGQAAVDDL